VSNAAGKKVVTLEGLGKPGKPHPLQQAFIEEQAVQCGYCINGMIMQAKALLDRNKNPDETQLHARFSGCPTCCTRA
jgi:nicotinate dehydrogenase subunit A